MPLLKENNNDQCATASCSHCPCLYTFSISSYRLGALHWRVLSSPSSLYPPLLFLIIQTHGLLLFFQLFFSYFFSLRHYVHSVATEVKTNKEEEKEKNLKRKTTQKKDREKEKVLLSSPFVLLSTVISSFLKTSRPRRRRSLCTCKTTKLHPNANPNSRKELKKCLYTTRWIARSTGGSQLLRFLKQHA